MTYKGKKIKLLSEFLTAMVYARGKYSNFFKISKGRKCEPRDEMWIYIQ